MVTKRERVRAGGFIISEEGPVSRDNGYLAEGQNLDAGTLLERNDEGDLVAWTAGDSPLAGILFAGTDARGGRVNVTIIDFAAVVALPSLTYPEGLAATSRDALATLEIAVRSDEVIADTAQGGGGAYVAKAVKLTDTGVNFLVIPTPLAGTLDGSIYLFTGWINNDEAPPSSPSHEDIIFMQSYPAGAIAYFCQDSMSGPDDSSPLSGFFQSSQSPDQVEIEVSTSDQFFHVTTWTFYAILCDLSVSNPGKALQIAVNRNIVATTDTSQGDTTGPMTLPINGEKFLAFGTDGLGGGSTFEAADWQWWRLSSKPDLAFILKAFIDADGKPVNPSVAAGILGTQSLLLSGDETSNGFAKNRGLCGTIGLRKRLQSDTIGSFFSELFATPSAAGPGPMELDGSVAGQIVDNVRDAPTEFVTSQFESTISVDGQIQQTSSTDFTDASFVAVQVELGGPKYVALTGATVGQTVFNVLLDDFRTNVSDQFESTISVDGQIQQIGTTDYAGHTVFVDVNGTLDETLTNATTSPSD